MSVLPERLTLSSTDETWSVFIHAMLESQMAPGVVVTLNPGRAVLEGMTQSGYEFTHVLDTDDTGVRAIRQLAVLMHFPVRDNAAQLGEMVPAVCEPSAEVAF